MSSTKPSESLQEARKEILESLKEELKKDQPKTYQEKLQDLNLKALSETYPEHIGKLRKLKQWAGVIGQKHLIGASRRQQKLQEAEERAAVKEAGWDSSVYAQSQGDEEMEMTILGDVSIENKKSSGSTLAKTLGTAALGAALGGGALTALPLLKSYLTSPSEEPQQEFIDTNTFSILEADRD